MTKIDMTPLRKARQGAFNKYEEQERKLREFDLYNVEHIGWEQSEPDDPAGWWLWIFTCVAAGMLVALFLGYDTIWTGPVQDHIEADVKFREPQTTSQTDDDNQ